MANYHNRLNQTVIEPAAKPTASPTRALTQPAIKTPHQSPAKPHHAPAPQHAARDDDDDEDDGAKPAPPKPSPKKEVKKPVGMFMIWYHIIFPDIVPALKVEEKVQGYNVTVITGNESEENLSSNVFLTIYGSKADSGRRKLNDDPGHFDQVS